MKLPEEIVLTFDDVQFAKILTHEEANAIADGILSRSSISISGRWTPSYRQNPYANRDHRDGCNCDFHREREKTLRGVGMLVESLVEWGNRTTGIRHAVMVTPERFYDALDAIATLLQERNRG